jgi:hypothetical protein
MTAEMTTTAMPFVGLLGLMTVSMSLIPIAKQYKFDQISRPPLQHVVRTYFTFTWTAFLPAEAALLFAALPAVAAGEFMERTINYNQPIRQLFCGNVVLVKAILSIARFERISSPLENPRV